MTLLENELVNVAKGDVFPNKVEVHFHMFGALGATPDY